MLDKLSQARRFPTGVHTDASASLAHDLKALGVNMAQCRACQGRWFALSCMVEAFNCFMAPRFVSTLVIVAVAFTALTVLT